MTASTSMSVFHQWLLADPASKASACAIMLHCDDSWTGARLILEIANYLNEYDDDGDGRWLPATPDLVQKIASEPNHRRLLGLPPSNSDPSSESPAEYRNTLAGLSRRGHVVFLAPDSSADPLDLANTFHAGVGSTRQIPEKCHLFLNSALMDQKCIAHIIGDVFLEWLHCDLRCTPIHEIP